MSYVRLAEVGRGDQDVNSDEGDPSEPVGSTRCNDDVGMDDTGTKEGRWGCLSQCEQKQGLW